MKFEISEDEIKTLAVNAAWCFITSVILGTIYFFLATIAESGHRLDMAKLAVEQAAKIEMKPRGRK